MIVVATGQKIGEGFDCPRLDTLMLASPVKFDGRLIQYVGRLNRTYEGKTNVIVYDYVDAHIPMFDNQYRNRLAAYKRIGYRIQSGDKAEKQTVNSIFDRGNYTEVFEQDLVEAEREIVVASPGLRWRKVERMLSLLATRQEAGVNLFDNSDELRMLIRRMRVSGVEVVLTESENEHYAVMDGKLVWHGGMNLLGREGAWDNLIGGKHPGCNGVAGDDGGSEIPPNHNSVNAIVFQKVKQARPGTFLPGRVCCYPVIFPMYLTLTSCPSAVRSVRMYLKVRSGHIFFTIWPPMDPASREVREPL